MRCYDFFSSFECSRTLLPETLTIWAWNWWKWALEKVAVWPYIPMCSITWIWALGRLMWPNIPVCSVDWGRRLCIICVPPPCGSVGLTLWLVFMSTIWILLFFSFFKLESHSLTLNLGLRMGNWVSRHPSVPILVISWRKSWKYLMPDFPPPQEVTS